MAKKKGIAKTRTPQDATMRNVRAATKQRRKLAGQATATARDVEALAQRVGGIEDYAVESARVRRLENRVRALEDGRAEAGVMEQLNDQADQIGRLETRVADLEQTVGGTLQTGARLAGAASTFVGGEANNGPAKR